MKELVDECENRIVLFDNYLADKINKEQQVDKLLDVVNKLKAGGKRYIDTNFKEAKETRQRAKIESQHCIINEKTKQETSLIFQKLEQIQELDNNNEKKMKELLQLKERCSKLLEDTKFKDQGTNVLQNIISAITSQKKIVTKEIENTLKREREKQELAKRNEENRKKKKQTGKDYEWRLKNCQWKKDRNVKKK
ncbi:PHLOEM PROTEIN 2-LIKE A3 [Biomphalaria pfeifferi]|uniref:PHLOEM PROTEIN 2-LIKE A3 n=1 Tax=Biomphalaria pfeifferi TaxID=112525 RepID=A0AAD8C6Z9_BIOPF|nr:PHLOEM PROTEIN 2-LIKE A3 [Biomphalaria pfeifferi]